jgi:MraZ protein
MFRGRSSHTLDDKGRLIIPSRFMESLKKRGEDTLVITNHEDCLVGFTKKDWEDIEEKAARLPLFDPVAQAYLRYFISGAEYCQIKNGKITIPHELRKIANIDKDVTLVGMTTRFEIWDTKRWQEVYLKSADVFKSQSNNLTQYGI